MISDTSIYANDNVCTNTPTHLHTHSPHFKYPPLEELIYVEDLGRDVVIEPGTGVEKWRIYDGPYRGTIPLEHNLHLHNDTHTQHAEEHVHTCDGHTHTYVHGHYMTPTVPISTLQSLTWLQYSSGIFSSPIHRNSLDTLPTQYRNHVSDCSVGLGLQGLQACTVQTDQKCV